jgi:hypothetical protein
MQVQVLYQNMEHSAWASCHAVGRQAASWDHPACSTGPLLRLACGTPGPSLSQKGALSPHSWLCCALPTVGFSLKVRGRFSP